MSLTGRIHLLDEKTANQIAAGEVVERPASVVKELVENSLDAGARRVVVEVDGGGRTLIRITDDGCGMSPDDAKLALQRHATSKIRTADDLHQVTTMGFRGEALPSIASVSRFELITRETDALSGYRVHVEGGKLDEEGEFGAPAGTRISVQDLFYNVPARLKYLKTNATEMGQIGDILTRLALANPGVAIRFHSGPTQVFATPGTGGLLDTITGLLGREMVKELMAVDYQDGAARVTGYICRPGAARAGRNHQYFFVNRRAIRTIQVRYALEEAYAHLLTNGRYPVCILFIEVSPEEVDVNVHPTKAEVRFEREREVRGAVYKAARQTLGAHLLIPGTTVSEDGEVTVPDRAGEKAAAQGQGTGGSGLGEASGFAGAPGLGGAPGLSGAPGLAGGAGGYAAQGRGGAAPGATAGTYGPPRQVSLWGSKAKTTDGSTEPMPDFTLPAGGLQAILAQRGVGGSLPGASVAGLQDAGAGAQASAGPEGGAGGAEAAAAVAEAVPSYAVPVISPGYDLIRSLRPLGQIHQSYIVCDGPEGLYVIDQHAAHERIGFERFLAAAEAAETKVQPLLFPITLDLTPAQMALWRENTGIFHDSGFEAEPFGGTTLLISGVPMGISEAHVARLVSDFLDKLQEEKIPPGTSVLDRRRRVLSAMAACKAAIKAHDALQPESITALLEDLARCKEPHTCPHGRPTIICMPITELEKRFKR